MCSRLLPDTVSAFIPMLMTHSCIFIQLPTTVKRRSHAYYVASSMSVFGCAQTDWNWTLRKLSSHAVAQLAKHSFMVNGSAVTLLPTVTCLGVIVHQEMLFADHVRRLASLWFYWLRQLHSIRQTLTMETMMILVHALVISWIDYCNGELAGAYDVHVWQLQAVLNAAARLIIRKRKYDSISSTMRDILHWLPIRQQVCSHVQLPAQYITQLFVQHVSAGLCQPQPPMPTISCTW